jgi:VCBS repeat-containing protein
MSLAANANGIALVSGDPQSGAVGTTLSAPLVVVVTDAFGNPIPNVAIEWSVTGGGSASALTTLTGDNGQASVTRTLGPTAGVQTTVATANLVGSPITFNHTATAGNAARVIVVDGNGQSAPAGTKLDRDLVVRLLDAQNNPISGRAVSWVVGTGGGSASPETSNTDGNGEAKTEWTLGPTPGPNTLTAVVSGVGNGSFNATGTRLESNTQIASHQPEPALVGTPVTVGVNVSGSGGPPSGQVTVAGDGVPASSCNITLANGSGSCQITFAQPGNRAITATYAGDTRFSGSSDTENHQVSPAPVPNNEPTAAFTPPSCTTGQACPFSDQSSDSDGSIASRLWEFQDGSPATSTDPNPSIVFASQSSKTVTLTVTDDDGATNSVTHQVTVTDPPAANTAPTANSDAYTTGAGAVLTVPAPGVLANDSDPDIGDAVSAQNASDPLQGSVSLNSDGAFTYTPDATASGTDSFTYEASDGSATSQATVTITINP